ncbi:hypothetical protein [Streptomyces sp. NPDC057494]|uniref:hypothetical protein n=1 Tax=Streptomyces sp. NPDC057494 TaxID=3346148 RepID=UPI0036CC2187
MTSTGVRPAQMTQAIVRGYDLPEPDQTHAVDMAGQRHPRLRPLEAAGTFDHTDIAAQQSRAWTSDRRDTALRTRSTS